MFSQLGPLFKTHLRQAEHADARLEIRREDKHDQGKKNEQEQAQENAVPQWEDSTEVSIGALRTFLMGFLKARGEMSDAENNSGVKIHDGPREEKMPNSPIAAKAVKAYATMAVYSKPEEPPVEIAPTPPDDGKEFVRDLLQAQELRTIHGLIADLDILGRNGHQTLMIEKADTFLEALVQAVRLAKSGG